MPLRASAARSERSMPVAFHYLFTLLTSGKNKYDIFSLFDNLVGKMGFLLYYNIRQISRIFQESVSA
jgi:hypothetical protein